MQAAVFPALHCKEGRMMSSRRGIKRDEAACFREPEERSSVNVISKSSLGQWAGDTWVVLGVVPDDGVGLMTGKEI